MPRGRAKAGTPLPCPLRRQDPGPGGREQGRDPGDQEQHAPARAEPGRQQAAGDQRPQDAAETVEAVEARHHRAPAGVLHHDGLQVHDAVHRPHPGAEQHQRQGELHEPIAHGQHRQGEADRQRAGEQDRPETEPRSRRPGARHRQDRADAEGEEQQAEPRRVEAGAVLHQRHQGRPGGVGDAHDQEQQPRGHALSAGRIPVPRPAEGDRVGQVERWHRHLSMESSPRVDPGDVGPRFPRCNTGPSSRAPCRAPGGDTGGPMRRRLARFLAGALARPLGRPVGRPLGRCRNALPRAQGRRLVRRAVAAVRVSF